MVVDDDVICLEGTWMTEGNAAVVDHVVVLEADSAFFVVGCAHGCSFVERIFCVQSFWNGKVWVGDRCVGDWIKNILV